MLTCSVKCPHCPQILLSSPHHSLLFFLPTPALVPLFSLLWIVPVIKKRHMFKEDAWHQPLCTQIQPLPVSWKEIVVPVFTEKTWQKKKPSELPLLHLQMTRFLRLQVVTGFAPWVYWQEAERSQQACFEENDMPFLGIRMEESGQTNCLYVIRLLPSTYSRLHWHVAKYSVIL